MLIIERWDVDADGTLIEAAVRARMRSAGYDVMRTVHAPGTIRESPAIELGAVYAVVSGRVRFTVADETADLEAGESLHVAPSLTCRAEVLGGRPSVTLDGLKRP